MRLNSLKYLFLLPVVLFTICIFPIKQVFAESLILDEHRLVTDYQVNSILFDDDYAYLGGEFNNVGYFVRGGWFITNTTTGAADLSWPEIVGEEVSAIISDGAGGWYIGGNFTKVGEYQRNNIAHILADKSVDPNWNPNSSGRIYAMADSGEYLYIGGSFTSVGEQSRNRLAKINKATGVVDSNWNPNSNQQVSTITVLDSNIYVAGYFSSIGGVDRNYLAKLNNTTGAVDTEWIPNPNDGVDVITTDGTSLYVGGYFTTIGGQTRNRIAKLNNTTGAADATWNPNPNNDVSDIKISGTSIYVGGKFTTIGGQSVYRAARVNNTTGAADATWKPNANARITTITLAGSDIYLGGIFTTMGGQTRRSVAKVNNTTGALDTNWNANLYGKSSSWMIPIAVSGSNVFIGGGFFLMDNVVTRNYLARVNLTTGLLDQSWNPNPNNKIYSMALSDESLYLGGDFTTIGGQNRNRIAKLNKTTGIVDGNWNPNSNNGVHAITLSGTDIYVGGLFTNIGGQNRDYIAKLNNTTGAADLIWAPYVNTYLVDVIGTDGTYIYANNDDSFLISKLNTTTGGVIPGWNNTSLTDIMPDGYNYGYAKDIQISDGYIFITAVYYADNNSIFGPIKINASSGLVDPNWNLQISDTYEEIMCLETSGTSLIVGGFIDSIKGTSAPGVAKIDTITGIVDPYFTQDVPNLAILEIAISGRKYWFGTSRTAPYLFAYTLESTPPTAAMDNLINTKISDSTPTLSGTSSDAHTGVANVEFQIDSTSGTWSNCTANDGTFNEGTEAFSCTPNMALSEGSHTIYVRAKDSNDNTTLLSSYATKSFIIDTVAPTLTITSIDNYPVTQTRWLTNRRPLFEGISEASSTIQVQVSGTNISSTITSDTNGYWTWRNSSDIPLGTHQITFTTSDDAGNTSSTSVILVILLNFGLEEPTGQTPTIKEILVPEENPPDTHSIVETEDDGKVLQFFDKDNNPMVSALIVIEGREYYTDKKGKIKVAGLEEEKTYKVKIEYDGIKYETAVLGASIKDATLTVNISEDDVAEAFEWEKVLIYGGIAILVLGPIVILFKKAREPLA